MTGESLISNADVSKQGSARPNHASECALAAVGTERKRQLALKDEGRFSYTLSDDGMTDFERLACIVEEVGEVGRNVLRRAGLATDGDDNDAALRKELSQIAALAVAWMERL